MTGARAARSTSIGGLLSKVRRPQEHLATATAASSSRGGPSPSPSSASSSSMAGKKPQAAQRDRQPPTAVKKSSVKGQGAAVRESAPANDNVVTSATPNAKVNKKKRRRCGTSAAPDPERSAAGKAKGAVDASKPSKQSPATAPVVKNSDIDDLFASRAAAKKVLSENAHAGAAGATAGGPGSSANTRNSKKRKNKPPPSISTAGASASDLFGHEAEKWKDDGLGGIYDQSGWTNRKLGDNTKIYKAHLIEERDKPGAGTTKLCPFDCDCCFGFGEDDMEGFLKQESKKMKKAG